MRKALIVGIDHYARLSSLSGCVNDAASVHAVLERNADGTRNFIAPRILTAARASQAISKHMLKTAVRELFTDPGEIALFYFAGHGYIEDAALVLGRQHTAGPTAASLILGFDSIRRPG